MRPPLHIILLSLCTLIPTASLQADEPLLNMKELLDAGTLKVKVLKDSLEAACTTINNWDYKKYPQSHKTCPRAVPE